MDPITIAAIASATSGIASTLVPALKPRTEGQFDRVDTTIKGQSNSLIWITVGLIVFLALIFFIIWRLTRKK